MNLCLFQRNSLRAAIAAAGISRTTARFEQHCYGEAATFVFGVWASGMDPDGTLHWALPDRRKSYYDEDYLPKKLDRVDEAGNLYFDGSNFPWKLADDFEEDKRPRWKVLLGKLTGKNKG